jgi:hypothetical protein
LTNKTALTWMAIALWTVDGIAFVVFICLLKNIKTSIAIIRTTATFTEEQARTVFVPIAMFIMIVNYVVLYRRCSSRSGWSSVSTCSARAL